MGLEKTGIVSGSEISPGLVRDFMVSVPHVTQRNGGRGVSARFHIVVLV